MTSVRLKRNILTGLLLFMITWDACSQEIITLERAINTGLDNNYGIRIAKSNLQIATNDASPGNAGFLPTLDLLGSYTHSVNQAKVEMVTGQKLDAGNASSDIVGGGLNLSWTLFDGCNMFIRYNKLKTLEEIGELNLRIAAENTVAAITVAFFNIVKQATEVQILTEQVDISKFRLELAKTMYETGSGSELELLKSRVELNEDISALEDQKTKHINSKTYLNQLLAREINTPFEVNDSIVFQKKVIYDSVYKNMLVFNHELLVAGKDIEAANLDFKSAGARQFPEIDFLAGLTYYKNETEASMVKFNRLFGPSIGISASFNLFDGFNMNRQRKDAQISVLVKEIEARRLELKLEAYSVRLFNEYTNQLQLVSFETENLELARRNMEIASASYSVGAISSLQLREIQKNLLNARLRLLTARFEAKTRETALMLLSGKLHY